MPGHQINPILVELLSNKQFNEIPSSPTISQLSSKYASQIRKNQDMVDDLLPVNHYMMKCESCGRKGQYNIGLLVVNVDAGKKDMDFQMTGYFRCKHCNVAGNWEDSNDIYMLATTSLLAPEQMKDRVNIGDYMLYDGSKHKYASDGEEHLLSKIREYPNDAFAWNRLGNLYHKGGRPELAVAAFEKSLSIDSKQVESHYTLGSMLSEIGDVISASYHFKQMSMQAAEYKDMHAEDLRGMLANGLLIAFSNSFHSQKEDLFLPKPDDFLASGKRSKEEVASILNNLEIVEDDVTAFYPLAEMYMEDRQKEIPRDKRSLKVPSSNAFKKKKKKRTKRNRR